MRCSRRRAVVGWLCHRGRSTSSTWARVTFDTRSSPRWGKTSRFSPDIQSWAYLRLRQPDRICAHTSSAAAATVGVSAKRRLSVTGSPPPRATFRLVNARARASSSEVMGYPPRPISRRRPSMVMRCTQLRLPDGCTSRYSPLPSRQRDTESPVVPPPGADCRSASVRPRPPAPRPELGTDWVTATNAPPQGVCGQELAAIRHVLIWQRGNRLHASTVNRMTSAGSWRDESAPTATNHREANRLQDSEVDGAGGDGCSVWWGRPWHRSRRHSRTLCLLRHCHGRLCRPDADQGRDGRRNGCSRRPAAPRPRATRWRTSPSRRASRWAPRSSWWWKTR